MFSLGTLKKAAAIPGCPTSLPVNKVPVSYQPPKAGMLEAKSSTSLHWQKAQFSGQPAKQEWDQNHISWVLERQLHPSTLPWVVLEIALQVSCSGDFKASSHPCNCLLVTVFLAQVPQQIPEPTSWAANPRHPQLQA